MNILQQYKENEEVNAHAENYCLLANNFGSESQQYLANMNLARRNRLGYADHKLSALTHAEINPLYYQRLAKEPQR